MAKPENRLKGSYQNIISLPMSIANVNIGEQWYVEANKVARTVGVLAGYSDSEAVKIGAGILSALSPMRDWDLNIAISLLLVTDGIQKHVSIQHNKALAIMGGADPMVTLGDKARKTQAFYQAILDPNNTYSPPVIDRHAVAVYLGRVPSDKELKALDSYKVYGRIEQAYVKASKVTGINHHMLQAMTWTQWRENKGLSGKTTRQLAFE